MSEDPCDGCDGTCGDMCPVWQAKREAYERIRPPFQLTTTEVHTSTPVVSAPVDGRDERRWTVVVCGHGALVRGGDPCPTGIEQVEVVPASERDRLADQLARSRALTTVDIVDYDRVRAETGRSPHWTYQLPCPRRATWTRLASGTVRLALGYRLPGMPGVTVAETNTEMN